MTGVFKVSPPFIRNWARVAILSLLALSGVALAQAGGIRSHAYKFLKAVREGDATAVTTMVAARRIVMPVAKWLRIPEMQMVEIPRVEPVWAAT